MHCVLSAPDRGAAGLGLAAGLGACSTTPVAPVEADRAITTAEAHFAAQDYDLVVTELRVPSLDAFAVLREGRRRTPGLRALVITGRHHTPGALKLLREPRQLYDTRAEVWLEDGRLHEVGATRRGGTSW